MYLVAMESMDMGRITEEERVRSKRSGPWREPWGPPHVAG